jgi:Protein of unknown function (DUF3810)
MVELWVKGKLWKKELILPSLALLTFTLSWAGAFPQKFVENWYSRLIYPTISTAARIFADAASFAWLDVIIPIGLTLLVVVVHRKKFYFVANAVAVLYLIFFWTWGLNYHRQPLIAKIPYDAPRMDNAAIETFANEIAEQINRSYVERQREPVDELRIRKEAVERVRRVAAVIDGAKWQGSSRIKNSFFANPWFHAAGIDGVFNLFAHEPLVTNTLLQFEKPFVMTHELAHVYGYAGEGDANLIAVFATLMSPDPHFQYSGWINLWLYVRNRKLDRLLEPGPRQDFDAMLQRMRSEQIQWLSAIQGTILDWYLKSNSVHEGIRSYSQVVRLAAGTEPYWDRFR